MAPSASAAVSPATASRISFNLSSVKRNDSRRNLLRTFERYHIVSDRDIREVAVKMANFLPESPAMGTLSGTLTGTPEN